MRRTRITIKPNVRPGNRNCSAGEQTSHASADADPTLPTVKAEKAASPQVNPPVEETAEALGVKNDLESPLEKSSSNQHDGAPSSGSSTSAAVPQRRMRLSATPKLSSSRVNPATQPSARNPSLASPTLPSNGSGLDSIPDTTALGSMTLDNVSHSTSPKVTLQLSTSHPPMSPCVPSTSDLQKRPVCDRKSAKDSLSSPQQLPQELKAHRCSSQVSDVPSECVKSTCFNQPGSAKETDKEKILRALKLKELMKIERRKDVEKTKKTVKPKQEYDCVDRSTMTMRDLIYYLPNTSPMRASMVSEEDQAEVVVPPSPKVPQKVQETDEEESDNEGMLMPKVRVAEDGSIILDEDSLTVRVQRASKTAVLENSNPLFERGSTTTYTSFRNLKYTKCWSVRETDMFFLAISMVGTDFSLIGQLLPHRSRAEIKSKFKKEERASAWRIDKSFRNKRPYDKEFFSYLLEKVLAKDKEKGKSVKLVMTKSAKAEKARRGKKAKLSVCEEECLSRDGEEDRDFEMEDGGHVYAEKENENLSNVNETDTTPAKRKRKWSRQSNEAKDEEKVKRRKRKCSKKTSKGNTSSDDGGLFNLEDDPVNANTEVELDSKAPAPKKKRKTSKTGGEEGEVEKPAGGRKGTRRRKSLKVRDDHECISANESGLAEEDRFVVTAKKCKRSKKADLKTGGSTKGEKSANGKLLKATVNEETEEHGEASTTGPSEADKNDALVSTKAMDMPQQKSVRYSKKPKPNLGTRGRKRISTTEPDETETGISPSEKGQLQKEAEAAMERTPKRDENEHGPLKVQCISKESEPLQTSPASQAISEGSPSKRVKMHRAERAKRNLRFYGQKERRKETVDYEESMHGPDSEDGERPTEKSLTQDSEDFNMDNTLDEKLQDISYLHALDSPMFHRRPLVMLSREEVDMILSVQAQQAAEQPLPSPSSSSTMSPLDLSLNTEPSFQFSNLMEEDVEAHQDECVEESSEVDSQSAVLESHCNDLEIMDSPLGQSDLLSTRHFSTSFNSHMNNKPVLSKVETSSLLEKSEPLIQSKTSKDVSTADSFGSLATIENVASEDPAYTKPNANGTHKRTDIALPESETHCTFSTTQDATEANKTSVRALVQESLPSPFAILERSQKSVVATPKIGDRSHDSVLLTPKIGEDMQESLLEPAKVLERSPELPVATPQFGDRSQESVLLSPEIGEDMQGSHLEPAKVLERSLELPVATPQFGDRSQESVLFSPEIGEDMQESLLEPAKDMESSLSQQFVVTALEIKDRSQRSVLSNPEMKQRSEGMFVSTQLLQEDSLKVSTPEIKPGSQASVMMVTEMKDFSQRSLREPAEDLERSQETIVPTSNIMEGLQASELMTIEIKENSERSLLETHEVLENSGESVMTTLDLDGLQGALLASPRIKKPEGSLLEPSEESQMSVVVTQEIKVGTQESVKPVNTVELKQMPEGSVVNTTIIKDSIEEEGHAIPPSSTKSNTSVSSGHDVILKRRSRFLKPKPNLNLASRIVHYSPKQKSRELNKSVRSEKLLHQGPASDQQCDLDFSKEISIQGGPCLSSAVPKTEPKPTKVVPRGESATVLGLDQTITLSEVRAPVLQLASDQTRSSCDVELHVPNPKTPACQSVADDFQKMDRSCVWPLPSQTTEQERTGHTPETCQDLCAPAKVIHSAGDGQSDEEPTFILTLYEIPIAHTDSALASNDTAVTIAPVEIQSPPTSFTLPYTPVCPRESEKDCVGISQNESSDPSGKVTEDVEANIPLGLNVTLVRGAGFSEETSGSPPETEGSLPTAAIKEMVPADIPRQLTIHTQEKSNMSSVLEEKVALEEMEDYVSKESTTLGVINLHGECCSSAIPAKLPSEELKKVKHPPGVCSSLFNIIEDSKYKPSLLEEKKAPAKRKGKLQPKQVKRSRDKNNPMKTVEPVMEQSQPSLSQDQTMEPQAKEASGLISTRFEPENLSRVPKEKIEGNPNVVSETLQGGVLQQKYHITPCTVSLSKKSVYLQHRDFEEAKDYHGVSHMGTADVLKPGSKVTKSISQSIPLQEEKVAGIPSQDKDFSTACTESTKQNYSFSKETKTLGKKTGKQQMKRAGANNDSSKTAQHTEKIEPSSDPSTELEKADILHVPKVELASDAKQMSNQAHLEEELRRKHEIMPCTVRISKGTDSVFVDSDEIGPEKNCDSHMVLPDISLPISGEIGENQLKPVALSGSAHTPSDKPPITETRMLKELSVLVKRESPARLKEMLQLPITYWAKTIQPAAELEADDPSKKSGMMSVIKTKESSPLVSNKSELAVGETLCSRAPTPGLKETERACEKLAVIAEMEQSGELATMTKIDKESNEGPSGSPTRSRAKLRVKPKRFSRTCAKNEDSSSKTGQPPSTPFTSPRLQHARAAKIKKDKTTMQQTQDLSDASKIENINSVCMEKSFLPSDSWFPKSPPLSPRVVLSRVRVPSGETGCSSFCSPASSPAKASTSTYQRMSPPQQIASGIVPPPQRSSPTSSIPSEDGEDEPSRVAQFFIQDIFTEMEDAD